VKTPSIISRVLRGSAIIVLISAIGASVSCMTTYDAYGNPVQSVDPAAATAGVVAAGLLGYALADDNHGHHNNHYYHGGGHYYRGGGGYYRGGGGYRPYHR
jgi:hypothetical protein